MTRLQLLAGCGLFAAGVTLGAVAGHRWLAEPEAQKAPAKTEPHEAAAEPAEHPSPTVQLPVAAVASLDLATAALAATDEPPRVACLGRLEADPAATCLVRAPLAGTLVANPERAWPTLGTRLDAGVVLGLLAPRLLPVERTDLEQRALAAEVELAAASTALAAATKTAERARVLNADGKNVSDRELEEADAKVATETSRRDGATRSLAQLRGLLAATPAAVPLLCPGPGTIVEAFAHLGEHVDAGQQLLRVQDPTRLLARLVVPIGITIGATDAPVPIALPGTAQRYPGHLIGRDADGVVLCTLTVPTGSAPGPGLPVTGWLPQAAPAAPGLFVPMQAAVRHRGQTFVFVRLPAAADAPTAAFALRSLPTEQPTLDGWFVPLPATELASGDAVVVRGAAALLSQLLHDEIPATDEAPDEGK